jgi:predicted HTH transcriptional regulator
LFAKKLDEFHPLRRKAVRVIVYKGSSRVETLREQVSAKGYANGFEGLVDSINGLLPTNEIIVQALRKTVPMYPELAVRELVANALIHQEFFETSSKKLMKYVPYWA